MVLYPGRGEAQLLLARFTDDVDPIISRHLFRRATCLLIYGRIGINLSKAVFILMGFLFRPMRKARLCLKSRLLFSCSVVVVDPGSFQLLYWFLVSDLQFKE